MASVKTDSTSSAILARAAESESSASIAFALSVPMTVWPSFSYTDTRHGGAMLRSISSVRTLAACAVILHTKIPVTVEGNQGRLEFHFGTCTTDNDDESMHIRIDVPDTDELDRAEDVVARDGSTCS